MSRTILPPWSEFRKTLGVEQPEPIETFDWMLDDSFKKDLQLAKEGIDSIEGARAFLKDYRHPLEHGEMDPMRYQIGAAIGRHHSGASCSMLMNTYTYLLNNWDEFVLKTKDREQRKASNYDNRQIHYSDQDDFLDALKEANEDPEDREKATVFANFGFNFRAKFSVSYDNETLTQMIRLIKREESAEGRRKILEAMERKISEEVEMLTFLYKCPIRWFSYEDGLSPLSVTVTAKHIDAMAAMYPDYRDHYAAVDKARDEWQQLKDLPEKKPTAAFFEVFSAPHVLPTEMYMKKQTHPDYETHIQAITKNRETLLDDMVLGRMFASPAVLKIKRAAEAAMAASCHAPLSSLFSKA